jgi:hypothetical protein
VPNGVSSLNGLLSKLQSEGDACSKLNRRIFSARSLTARLSSPEAAEVLQLGNVTHCCPSCSNPPAEMDYLRWQMRALQGMRLLR